MTYCKTAASLSCAVLLVLAACSPSQQGGPDDGNTSDAKGAESASSSDDTRPVGQPGLVTVEGRITEGAECLIIRTPDGEVWALSLGEADFGPGDYVRLTGEAVDASLCMQGEATLAPQRIEVIEPPARDRDPARAGGVDLTDAYLVGSWVAKAAEADCSEPDFSVSRSPGALVMEADISNHDRNAAIVLGDYPRLDLDEPMPDLPMESRGPDGVAILRPATDADYEPVSIGSATITGDGVVFVKCG